MTNLSDKAKMAMHQAQARKSFARIKYDETIYAELKAAGFFNWQNAITAWGRKTLEEIRPELKAIYSAHNVDTGLYNL